MCLGAGDDAGALEAYTEARRLGDREAVLALAEMANLEYRTDDARSLLEDYRKLLKKGKRTVHPDNSGDLDDRIDRTENMLGRVEQIEVIDSLIVDADDFFRHYRLSAESGSLNAPADVLPTNFKAAEPTVVYEPESRRQMIWAAPDTAGNFALYSTSALYGNLWEIPTPLGDDLGEGGDANYPFLMPDGITLYFANDGENSLGGLDIFISRRGDDSFLQPQNIGMPYNSPYDDYMLAIDELTGTGWWATDRNRIPGKVTIYTFIPSDNRVNVDADDPNLISLARLSDISLTREPGRDYTLQLPEPGERTDSRAQKASSDFELPIGSATKIYHRLSDFKSAGARQAMSRAINARAEINNIEKRLNELREAYRNGDRSNSADIRNLEHRLDDARSEYVRFTNTAIAEELKN